MKLMLSCFPHCFKCATDELVKLHAGFWSEAEKEMVNLMIDMDQVRDPSPCGSCGCAMLMHLLGSRVIIF